MSYIPPIILLLLLAGCAAPTPEPILGEETPLYMAPEFDGVTGVASRSGIYNTVCSAVAAHGSTLPRAEPMLLDVPANVTQITVTATWVAPHEFLDLEAKGYRGSAAFGGTSPVVVELDGRPFEGRPMEINVLPPTCRPPFVFAYYDDLQVNLAVDFA